MSQKKYRIIKIKSREYVQEVKYVWDPDMKKGRTIVVKHIGPTDKLSKKKVNAIKKKMNMRESQKKLEGTEAGGNTLGSGLEKIEQTSYPPLTPSEWVLGEVLEIINETPSFLSRTEVYEKFSNKEPSLEEKSELKTQVGFALTILEFESKIKRIGEGRKGSPYKYGRV